MPRFRVTDEMPAGLLVVSNLYRGQAVSHVEAADGMYVCPFDVAVTKGWVEIIGEST